MTQPVAIVDTNIVTSGLITSKGDSLQAGLLDGMLTERFSFLLSSALFKEYCDVLSRPKLIRYHRRSEEQIEGILSRIRAHATWFEPQASGIAAPDSGDQHLWDLLMGWRGAVLVTGDKKLLDNAEGVQVLLPADFLRRAGIKI